MSRDQNISSRCCKWFAQLLNTRALKLFSFLLLLLCSGRLYAWEVDQATKDFLREAAKPYRGVVIKGFAEDLALMHWYKDKFAPVFEELTGIKVEIEIRKDFFTQDAELTNSGDYDFADIDQARYIDFDLMDLTQLLKKHPYLKIPAYKERYFTDCIDELRFKNGGLFAVPTQNAAKVYLYRKDWYEDPKIQEAFFDQYGYELLPATTIEEYRNLSIFFSEYGRKHNLEMYGNILQTSARYGAGAYELLLDIFPAFGVYDWGINPDTYRATVAHGGTMNSQRAKDAFRHWISLLEYSHPISQNADWYDVGKTVSEGVIAQTLEYGGQIPLIIKKLKEITGGKARIGVALNPTAPGILEEAQYEGNIGYADIGGFGIPTKAKNKEAALLFVQFAGLPFHQVNPDVPHLNVVHLSIFDDPEIKKRDKELGGYFTVQRNYGALYDGSPPLPFHVPVRDIVMKYIRLVIDQGMDTDLALNKMAIEVEKMIEQLGYYSDKRKVKQSLNQ